jgi:anthranilate/para-aminobenzoate synthase component I
MTGAWERFVGASGSSEVAGYVERRAEGARPGRAWWFASAPETVTVSRRDDADALRSRSGRFLARHPGGAVVGYLGFDAVGLFEPALRSFPSGSPFPLGELALVPRVETAAVARTPRRPLPNAAVGDPLADSMPRPRFERGVRDLIAAIRDGEAFQVVLAHRRAWPRPADLLERAGRLREGERFSTFYYLRFGDRELVGASPESVAEVSDGSATIDPIAGTIPLKGEPGRRPLTADPKELCEHRMLVDLARNDLGRVARAGSVRLLWSERRVRYARLEHLVSRVSARLGPSTDAWDVLASAFPAGTVSGAPKIRATQLLREAEGSWRGPYAGTVALMLPAGPATFSLAIRGGFAAGPRLYTAAGAGIVHRSDPAREFRETVAKLSVVESALVGAAA